MHGLVHLVLRSLVLEKGGDDAWAAVLQSIDPEISAREFVELRAHDDRIIHLAVFAGAKALRVTTQDVHRLLGGHFVQFLDETDHLDNVRAYGNDMMSFLQNIDQMHNNLKRAPMHAGCNFPRFSATALDCEAGEPDPEVESFLLSYASARSGEFGALIEGMLPEVAARMFQQNLTLERLGAAKKGYNITWRVRVSARQAGCSPSAPTPPRERSTFERHAACTWHDALIMSAPQAATPAAASPPGAGSGELPDWAWAGATGALPEPALTWLGTFEDAACEQLFDAKTPRRARLVGRLSGVALAAAAFVSAAPLASSAVVSAASLCMLAALCVMSLVALYSAVEGGRAQRRLFYAQALAASPVMPQWKKEGGRWRMLQHDLEEYFRAAQAQAAIAARSKLIRVVMHDLRSPLLTVRNITDQLVGDGESSLSEPEVQEQLQALQVCVGTAEHIMSDMLDFERIDSGRFILVHRELKLRELLHAAQSVFATQALANGVSLTFEELPSSLAEGAFVGDLPRLTQVLSNGISNAIKFTEKGGNVRVSVMQSDNHARKGWSQVRVCVADDGIGLDARELATLRDGGVFTQVGMGQLQGRGGTGLGLNIARHILAAHHCSELKLTSAGHGKGATFEMLANLPHAGTPFADAILSPLNDSNVSERALAALTSSLAAPHCAVAAGELCMRCPLRAQCDEMQRLELKGPAAGLAAPLLAEVACLHVEDDKLLQRTIGIRLRKLDVTVVIATNGREALEKVMLRQADGLPPFSLVVMDNQMPVMNGATATAALRSGGFAGFILGMTGDPMGSADRTEFELSGLSACVDKTPEGMRTIVHILREQLAYRAASGAVEDTGHGPR